jgi:hypothetical protein
MIDLPKAIYIFRYMWHIWGKKTKVLIRKGMSISFF